MNAIMEEIATQAAPHTRDVFEPLNRVLTANFYDPDLQSSRIVLGTIQAHYLNIGDPAWLFVVAPPGSGKTTTSIVTACDLPNVTTLSEFTENSFLSGFFGHHEPGILEKLGETSHNGQTHSTRGDGIFLAKDFTTVLSMRHEKKAVVLAQLREIHDGCFKRTFGTGETKEWQGRVTIIAAVTPVLDRHYGIFNVLGERFMQLRRHRPDSPEAGEWAIRQQGREAEIQAEMRASVKAVFDAAAKGAPKLPDSMRVRIARLAEVVATGRTHVFRSAFGGREIEHVPEPEANTRLSKGLAAIAKGISSLQGRKEVAEGDLQDVFRVGLDCLPENRRRIVMAALEGRDLSSIAMPRTVRDREIEELEALGVVQGAKLSERTEELLAAASLKLE